MRQTVINRVYEKKIIAIVRGVYGDDCLKLAEALYKGGIELLEVTFDQSKPDKLTLTSDTVGALRSNFEDSMLIGAGTVTSLEMLQLAFDAGAQFIVSPDTNEAVIRKTREFGLVSMPGAMTPSEIYTAYEYGADFVKVFPTSVLGSSYIKAVRGPINHIPLLAVGGVSVDNIAEFLAAGAVGAGIGGKLVDKDLIRNGEFDKITALAAQYIKNSR